MKQYYRLALNCGRIKRSISPYSNECGFIEVFPLKSTVEKKGFFGTIHVPTIEYSGWYYVIAELVEDHFEDIVLGKKIYFDPEGLYDITTASYEELENQLVEGLTCYSFRQIEPEVALYNMEKIKSDPEMLEKYIYELEELEKKRNVVKEMDRRNKLDQLSEDNSSDKMVKQRFRFIKSADI